MRLITTFVLSLSLLTTTATIADEPFRPEAGKFPPIEKSILGRGGFGVVYLATDQQLQRKVAIKVPHAALVERPEDAELYLKEARTVAGLEHPSIVPVHEVGSTPEFPIFVVSKYIKGRDLAAQLRLSPPTTKQAVQWVMDLADALRTAHKQGIVHRDIKPQNVLVDSAENVYLVDFGLALRDEEVGKRLPAGGTPAYMSPEQAKGEGHRVDGRSDIFSLGVLFYELLAGRRPFSGDSHLELFEQITDLDPKPIRQWNDSVDREVERICLKMLAKRKSERYSSARDLMDDLEVFLSTIQTLDSTLTNTPPVRTSAGSMSRPLARILLGTSNECSSSKSKLSNVENSPYAKPLARSRRTLQATRLATKKPPQLPPPKLLRYVLNCDRKCS